MTNIFQSGTSGTAGTNGTGGAGGAGQVEAGGYASQDISTTAEALNVVLTGGNGGIGGDGMAGALGVLSGDSWSGGGNGSPGGNAGAAGTAEFDLTNDTIGTGGTPDPNSIDVSVSTIGGNGNVGGFGGAGGSTGIDEPSQGITGGQGGNAAASGDDSDGAVSTNTITNLNANMSYGGMITLDATGGNGGTFDLNDNRAAGGNGAVGGIGGSAYSGGNGGNAVTTLSASTLTAGEFLGIDLSAEGGQGGDAGVQAAGGSSDGVAQPAKDGTVGNGGNAGNATATLTGNTITVGTAVQNGVFTLDMSVRTYTASEGSVDPTLKFQAGAPGATAPGQITITDNTITLGAGSGRTSGALMTLDLQNLELQTEHEIVGTEPLATETLNGGAGGNLDFSGNSFDGGGGGELTIEVGGGGVIADLLDNTISIGGSADNALIGFNTVILDDGETFIAGRDNETVEIGEAKDTVVFTAESGNLEIAGDTSTLVTGGATIDFAGFGPGLNAAAVAADTSVVSGNTFIKIGRQTLEIQGFTGNASGIETVSSLPALTQIVVTVAQMEGFETSHTLPAAGFTYIVTDTAANIEAATATQIRGFAANGASAIVSTDAALAFTVAQTLQIEGELAVTVPPGDGVSVTDTAVNIETLTTAQITALPAAGFTGITATDASVALTIAQGEALVTSGLPLPVPAGDMLTIADTYVALEALTPAEILAFKAAGVTGLTATVGSPVFSVAQALALADPLPVSVSLGNTVTIGDTAANLETLSASDIADLAGIGFTGFTSTDASVVLTAAQADAIGKAGIALTVPTNKTITVSDTAADIEALSKTDILALHAAGVTSVAATDGSVVLSITQAQGFEFPLPITVPMGDTVTIADTAANIEGLTAGDIGQLSQIGFTRITATDAPVVLTLAAAEAFSAGRISLTAPIGDAVTVSDTAVQIQALTGANIAALQAAGVTGILSTDASVTLSLTQAEALAGAGIVITVPSDDTVRCLTTISTLQMLTTGQIGELAMAGVTVISPTDSGSPGFSVAQTLALEAGGLRVVTAVAQEAAHIVDDATEIETLTPDEIKALQAAGFGSLNAFGQTLNLTLDQVQALENANISVPSDTVIVSETAAAVEALTRNDVIGFEQAGVGTIAADGPVVLTVAEALNLNGVNVTVPMGDSVTIMDTAANIAGLSTDDIGTLSRIGATAISVTDGSITLTLDQAQALESTPITVTAPMGDQVILTDTAADIEALGQSDIANLGTIGVTRLRATDASIVLTAANIQAFQSANITLSAPMGDTVTMSDTAADIEALGMGDIANLAATGVTAITATDAAIALTVFQVLDLEGAGIAISAPAHDGVTIVDTEAAVEGLSPTQLNGLLGFGITGLDVPSLTGTNPVTITPGIAFTVDGAISGNQTIAFSAEGGVLALGDPADDAGTVTGFGLFDTIDLTNVAFDPTGTASLQAGNGLGIIENSTGYNIQLDPSQSFLGESFVLSDDGNGGTDITLEQTAIITLLTISAGETAGGLTVGAGGEIDVLSGGTTVNITVGSGGNEVVESGGVISGATVEDGGNMDLNPGGAASGVVLNFLGQESVASGATDSGTVIAGGLQAVFGSAVDTQIMGGTQEVESGGVVVGVTMDGTQDVENGGVATGVTVSSGGVLLVQSGGTISDITVLSGGEIELVAGAIVGGPVSVSDGGIVDQVPVTGYFAIAAGQRASELVTGAGGEIDVLSGGTLIGGTVSSGGNDVVESGGVISGTTVDDGGGVEVAAGGTTFGIVLNDPGQESVGVGGTASATVIDGGLQAVFGSAADTQIISGTQDVESGGMATGVTVGSGGFFLVLSGASASDVTVLSGGQIELIGGGTISGLTVSSGGIEAIDTTVSSGQTVTTAVVSSAGVQYVLHGGTAIGTTVDSGGIQQVQGTTTGTVLVGSGATQNVSSGGNASGTRIGNGGSEVVSAGGQTSGVVVSSGGILEIVSGGVGSGITVLSGGELELFGGTVTGVTLSNGGIESVSSGATASGTHVLKGGEIIYAGGTVTGAVIASGGLLAVAAGAKASGIAVGNGVTLTVSSAGTASGAIVSGGGKVLINSRGTTVGATISSGGIETVSSGATAGGTHVLKGGEIVYGGGTVTGAVVSSGGLLAVAAGVKVAGIGVGNGVTLTVSSGGTASGAIVSRGGKALVDVGGTTVAATISSGGVETVGSGAHASGTHVLKGGEIVYGGGTITGAAVSSGGLLAVAAGVKVAGIGVGNGVTLTVSSGGTASGAIVSGGGKALVDVGGTTVAATISSGGVETVSSGAHASGTHVLKGGEIVYAGGTITTPAISSGGSEGVAAGVKVSSLTVGAGVTLFVSSGGTASATILGGREIVSAGGIVGGTTKFEAHGKLTVSATTGVALSISGFAATDTLDLAGFGFKSTEKLTFVENKAKTSGVLTVTDGVLHASVTLFGQYVVAGFHRASDGVAGTDITYASPPAAHLELAAHSV
jgi:autotransporter passenger strand-loop-strand repeat protein